MYLFQVHITGCKIMSKQQEIINNVNTAIKAITGASKIVRSNVQVVSDDFITLNHIGGLDRIPFLATRMVGAMTALDSKGFKLFIQSMYPLEWDEETKCFDPLPIKEQEEKDKCKAFREVFLEEYQNNYWLWVGTKVKVDKKDTDWIKRFDSAWSSVTSEKKGKLSVDEVLLHIIEKQGLTLETFLKLLTPKELIQDVEYAAIEEDKAA